MTWLGLLAVLASVNVAQAACPGTSCTYWVDAGCPNNGNGSQRGCAVSPGGAGPFKTIQAAINQAIADQPGANNGSNSKNIAIEVRGPHAASHDSSNCAGTTASTPYNESINLAGTKALVCAGAHPCVIEGCSAANCGTNETAVNSGLKLRNDWTAAGGGVYYRTMEARTDWPFNSACAPGGGNGVVDSQDPGFLVQGTTPDDTRTFIQHSMNGLNDTVPAAGRWSYVTSTHRVYVHLSDGSDPSTKVWVPDQVSQLYSDGYMCTYAANGMTNVTIRRFVMEGGRLANWVITNHSGYPGKNFTMEDVTLRYATYINFLTRGWIDFTAMNVTLLHNLRGSHDTASTTGNGFHLRGFDFRGTTWTNIVAAHGGEAGVANAGCTGGINSSQPALDAKWGVYTENPYCHGTVALEFKQSSNVMLNNVTVYDEKGGLIQFDSVDGAVVDGGTLSRASYGISNPDANGNGNTPGVVSRNLTVRNVRFDNIGRDGMAALWVTGAHGELGARRCVGGAFNPCSGGSKGPGCICTANGDCASNVCTAHTVGLTDDYTVLAYNNMFSRVANAGIFLDGWSPEGVYLWNNTFFEDRGDGFPAYSGGGNWNYPAAAIKFAGTGDSASALTSINLVEVKNNIFADTELRGLHIGSGISITNTVVDYNSYSNEDGEWTASGKVACAWNTQPSPIKWGANCYGANALATFTAETGQEAHSIRADPRFVSTTNLDFRLCSASGVPAASCTGTSPAIDAGVNVGLPFSGSAPDLGASEAGGTGTGAPAAPVLIDVMPAP